MKRGVEIVFLMIKCLYSILLSLFSCNLIAQEIPVGSWRMHVSYQSAIDVTLSDTKVFTASKNGIFIFDQLDNSIQTLTKLDGLSDSDISSIGFSTENAVLLVGYNNGNVDIIGDGRIYNFPVVKNSDYEFKRINDFLFANNTCFISTDFGVVILDLINFDLLDSYEKIGSNGSILKISQSVLIRDSLFLATDEGVIAGWLDPLNNLKDFNNWRRFDSSEGIPADTTTSITLFQNDIYSSVNNNGIYKYDGSWSIEPYMQGSTENTLAGSENLMTISTPSKVYLLQANDILEEVKSSLIKHPFIALHDSNSLWIADGGNSLVTDYTGNFSSISASGPASDRFMEIGYNSNTIISLPGGYSSQLKPFGDSLGFSVFEEGVWSNYTPPDADVSTDLIGIAFSSESVEMVSFGDGITQWANGGDPISVNSSSSDYPFLSDFLTSIFSNDGMWVTSYESDPSIYFNDGEGWSPVDPGVTGQDKILETIQDFDGNMWFRVDPTDIGGIIVYNHASNSANWLSTISGSGDLPSNEVFDLELDLNGNVWIGTSNGVAYFPRGVDPFGNVEAIKPVFEGRFLFGDELVTSIKTDGGNRKWFGTKKGAWLFDEFGEEFFLHFDDSEPLLSSEIVKIQINDVTGEIFFATINGLSSFRGNATEGSNIHSAVKIFPNPVIPGYTGVVSFEGLPTDAEVKITDLAGNLVWQTNSFGGTATWNLITVYGARPATGMYLIFSSNKDGKDAFVGKLAIVN